MKGLEELEVYADKVRYASDAELREAFWNLTVLVAELKYDLEELREALKEGNEIK